MPLETNPTVLPIRDEKRYIGYVTETHGTFGITQRELNYLRLKVTCSDRTKRSKKYHSHSIITKIRKYTDWNLNATQLMCRFAYKHGIVEL